MKTKLLVLLFLASLTTYAQYTLIPDLNFENKLIALGIDSGATDGKVLTTRINKWTTLDVSSSSISDLTGIQDFAGLTTLNCSSNQLTVLDIGKNTALSTLHCNSNQLSKLDISKNTELMVLNCFSNQLVSLDLNNHTKLRYLDCSSNQLALLDVSKNLALWNLYCYSNQLTTLDVSVNTGLTDFICSSNKLTSLDISNQKALSYLGCSSNKLTKLDVSENTVLWSLNCDTNQLTALDVRANIELEALNCFSNRLTSLDISNQTKLRYLNCYSNQITALDVSKNGVLWNFSCNSNQLTYLNLMNGNNSYFNTISFVNNPKLNCIQVENVIYSNANWLNKKDATASFNLSCPSLGTVETVFDRVAIYPNPTKGELHIDNIVLEKATVYDALGKLVKTATFTSGAKDNNMHLEGIPSGIYYIYLEGEGANTAKKIIVE
jgi:N6-adenosine-specific RNA methylase IME4